MDRIGGGVPESSSNLKIEHVAKMRYALCFASSAVCSGRRALSLASSLALMIALGSAAPSLAHAQCVQPGGDVPVPVKIQHVEPIYPPIAQAAGVQGIVILQITVDASGAVTSASVLRSIPLLDAAAVAAVNQWRYGARPSGSPCIRLTVEIPFALSAVPPPSGSLPPSNLQASAAGNVLTLIWQAPSTPPSAYMIEAGSAPGLSDIAIVQVASAPTSLSAQVPSGTYYIRVKAIVQGVASAASNEAVVTVGAGPECAPPSAPTLAVTVTGPTVALSWSPSTSGTPPFSYTLLAGSSPGASNLATAPMGAQNSFQTNVPAGTYFVRVVASNACGVSPPSNEVIATVGAPTGAPLLTFTVTPNPVPFTGVLPGCAGSLAPIKTWAYTLQITNQGTGPFTIASFFAEVTFPSQPVPVQSPPGSPQLFALTFGASTIPPQGSLVGQLCVEGHREDSTLMWTFVDASGQSFTAPLIHFLRSPF